MSGPKPDYKADAKVKMLREKERKTFSEISKITGKNVKNVYLMYRRAGGKLIGRLSTGA